MVGVVGQGLPRIEDYCSFEHFHRE
jgi:hypothetical protein